VRYVLTFGGIAAGVGLLAYGFTTEPRNIPSPLVGRQGARVRASPHGRNDGASL
jgi:hypothetical protein